MCAYAWQVWFLSLPEIYTGDLETARESAERGIELARQYGDPELEGWALALGADLALVAGDAELSLGPCRRSIEIAEKLGSVNSQVMAYGRLGGTLILAGQYDESIEVLEHALALARERRAGLGEEVRCLLFLAEAVMHGGDLERARTLADEAVGLGRRTGLRIDTIFALRALGQVLLRQAGTRAAAAIEAALDEADQLVEDTGARNLGPLILLERAELARTVGDAAARQRHLRAARSRFEEMSAPARVAEIDALLTAS